MDSFFLDRQATESDLGDVDLSGLPEAPVDSEEEEEEDEDLERTTDGLLGRDLVRECLEKEPADRNDDDIGEPAGSSINGRCPICFVYGRLCWCRFVSLQPLKGIKDSGKRADFKTESRVSQPTPLIIEAGSVCRRLAVGKQSTAPCQSGLNPCLTRQTWCMGALYS